MEEEALRFFTQVEAELRRLGVTAEDEAANSLEFSMPAGEYLAILRSLPNGAGWAVVKARLEALVPPRFRDGWKSQGESDDPGA